MPKRIMGLELLRGLCALVVAIYHCLLYGTVALPTWGLYAVYVFFGISGAVLYHNYHATLSTEITIPQFLLRRFARLAPLIWACILIPAVVRGAWDLDRYFLSMSLLQGFGSPGLTSYLVGGWTIGIECVLYVLFPTLLAFTRHTRTMLSALIVLLVLRLTFLNYILDGSDLDHAWGAYIQPAAFLWFFFGGMVLAKVMPQIPTAVHVAVGVACAIALFGFPGASFEAVLLGTRGAVLTVIALLIVGSFFWSPTSAIGTSISRFFGDISYGLYLMHPIVWIASGHYLSLPVPAHIAVTLLVSSAGAWLSSRYYERPMRQWIMRRMNG